MKKVLAVIIGLVVLTGVSQVVLAQPAPTGYTLSDIYYYLTDGTEAIWGDHDLEPPAGATPGDAQFFTLSDIYGAAVEHSGGGGGGLLVTGQTVSYGNRDDGELQMGEDFDLEVGDDDTVIDNVNNLQWTSSELGSGKSWDNALDWANNLTQDGKSDWRLPNITELQTLLVRDNAQGQPFINLTMFPNCRNSGYFSSTTHPNATDYALRVDFTTGCVSHNMKSSGEYVRAVRDLE